MGPPDSMSAAFGFLLLLWFNVLFGIPSVLMLWSVAARASDKRFRTAVALFSWSVGLNALWVPLEFLPDSILDYLSLNLRFPTYLQLVGFGLLIASAVKTRGSVHPRTGILVFFQVVFILVSLLGWFGSVQDPSIFHVHFWPPLH